MPPGGVVFGGALGAPCPDCLTRGIGTEYPQRRRWGTLGSLSLMPWVGGVLRGERLGAGRTPGGVAGPGRSAGWARVCRAPRVSLWVVWGTQTSASPPSPLSRRCQLGGCGILGVGIWLAATQGNFATLSSSFPSLSAANLLIVTGTFVMAIGFVGCIGAIKENKCLLLTVSAPDTVARGSPLTRQTLAGAACTGPVSSENTLPGTPCPRTLS